MILGLAEDANTHTPLGPGDRRIVTDRFVLWMGSGGDAHWRVAQRLRLTAATVGQTVAEVHDLVAARGHQSCTWEVGGSATPFDLVDRLLAEGMRPDAPDPHATGMVLRAPPGPPPAGVAVRAVETPEEFLTGEMIARRCFGLPVDGDRAEAIAGFQRYRASPHQAAFLALLDGRPVATAMATFTPHGVVLNAGATLPEARGNGAYRALVWARWQAAAARGTPALIAQAGRMSRPILERLGFEPVAEITILLDEFGER